MNKRIITSLLIGYLLVANTSVLATSSSKESTQYNDVLAYVSEDNSQFTANLYEEKNYEFDNSDLLNSKQLSAEYDIYSTFDYVTYDNKGNVKESALNTQLYYKKISIPSGGKAVVTVKKLSAGKTLIKFNGDKSISSKEINDTALFNVKLMEGNSYEFYNSDLSNSKQLMTDYDMNSTFDYVIYDSKGNIKDERLNVQLYINKIIVPAGGKAIVTVKKLSGRDAEEFAGDKSISCKANKETALYNVKLMEGDSYEFDNSDLSNSKQLMTDYDMNSTFDYVTYDSKENLKITGLNVQLYINKIVVPAGGKAIVTVKKLSGKDYEEFAGDKCISGKKASDTALFNVKLMEGDSYEFDNGDLSNSKQLMTDYDMNSTFDYATYDNKGNIKDEGLNIQPFINKITVPAGGKAVVTAKKIVNKDFEEFAGDKNVTGKQMKVTALFNVKLMDGNSYKFDNDDSENSLTVLTNADYYSSYSFVSYKEDGTISVQKDSCYDKSIIVPPKGKVNIVVNKLSSNRDNIEFAVYNKITASGDDDFREIADKVVDKNKMWTVNFTSEVGYDDNTKKNVLVKDSKGNLPDISIKLSENRKSILIYPPQEGYKVGEKYTLYILDNTHSKNNKNIKRKVKMNFTINN